jgi:DNA-binding transcriptional ArsR family regulator
MIYDDDPQSSAAIQLDMFPDKKLFERGKSETITIPRFTNTDSAYNPDGTVKTIPVIKNPSRRDIMRLLKKSGISDFENFNRETYNQGTLKYNINPKTNDLYVWDAFKETHNHVRYHLGLDEVDAEEETDEDGDIITRKLNEGYIDFKGGDIKVAAYEPPDKSNEFTKRVEDLIFRKKSQEPRPTDPSVLEKGIMATDIGSKILSEIPPPKKPPPGQELVKQDKRTGKGQMFRGLGSLMKGRVFPLVAMAKTFWGEIPEDIKDKAKDDAGEIVDWLRENKMHELVGLDKPGLEYFKEALMPTAQGPTDPMAMPNLWDDTASRMQRARDMGFDLDETLYHGTSDDIKYFSLTHPNRKDSGWLGTGVYLTDDPSLASIYGNMKPSTSKAGPNILPVHVKLKNPYYASINDKLRLKNISFDKGKEEARAAADAWTTELKKKGHDGVILEFDPKDDGSGSFGVGFPAHKEVVVFEPENIRSSFAKFDPADADSDFLSKAKGGLVDKPLYEQPRMVG